MANIKEIAVHILDKADNREDGVFIVNEFDSSERMMRAVKMLLAMWGIAAITLFIPLAHFILVPSFLLAGPIMAYSRYSMQQASESITGKCPVCHEAITFKLEAKDRPPIWKPCPKCATPLHVNER